MLSSYMYSLVLAQDLFLKRFPPQVYMYLKGRQQRPGDRYIFIGPRYLGSNFWVRVSLTPYETLLRLNWCDSGFSYFLIHLATTFSPEGRKLVKCCCKKWGYNNFVRGKVSTRARIGRAILISSSPPSLALNWEGGGSATRWSACLPLGSNSEWWQSPLCRIGQSEQLVLVMHLGYRPHHWKDIL